ncbi:MAG: HEAT repeat domain-containing protein [Sandaracinaceae bacterium]|nr:HEAT repeat domain-containing protein [Myxococcales bacterium]MCB9661637.1 HEAT repeat domain-containing protein [Sandaracinaceae bacterium]
MRPSPRTLFHVAALCVALLAAVSGAHARVSSREYLEQQLAESSDFRNRTQAALALGRLADARSRLALERALASDNNPAVRAAAAASLGKLGDRRAIGALRRASHDDSASVRRQAESSIAELRGEGGASTAPSAAAVDWRRVRHVVSVGQVSNTSSVGGSALVGPLREAVMTGLAGVPGVAPFGSADAIGAAETQQITRRRIPRFRVDAVLNGVQRTEQHGEVRLRASVNLTLFEEPSRNVLGMLSGAATAAEPLGQGRDQDLRMTTAALGAAVRSALNGAGGALERASRR